MTTTRADKLTAERLMADVEQGVLDDNIESYIPAPLFGAPTAAERAARASVSTPGNGATTDTGARAALESTSGALADSVDGAVTGEAANRPAKRRAQKPARSNR